MNVELCRASACWCAVLIAAMGCGGSNDAGPDASPGGADSGACTPECTQDGNLRTCVPDEQITICAAGCDPGGPACLDMVPSNGASKETHLAGVDRDLLIRPGNRPQDVFRINTDTGQIQLGEQTIRPAGENVMNGTGFYVVDDKMSVLAVSKLTVEPDGILIARGTRALVILSAGDVDIRGTIDISAFVCPDEAVTGISRCGGPGGGNGAPDDSVPASGCAPGGNGNGIEVSAGLETGGGGGGLGQDGAPGGAGGDGTLPGTPGNVGAMDCPGQTLVPLRGGSGGGAGAFEGLGGLGGGGGGALQITSFTRIAVLGPSGGGSILASGGGGGPGTISHGGGGGGSGGAILLEAPVIELQQAVLAANGGGGGGGGANETVAAITAGENGHASVEQAQGGASDFPGGRGGSAKGPAGIGIGGSDATGGGGGGVGIIRLNVPEAGLRIDGDTVISPAHTRGNPRSE